MKTIKGTNVVDAKINWKNGTYLKPNENRDRPEGLYPYAIKGVRETSPEAVRYMTALLQFAGVRIDDMSGWEEKLISVQMPVMDRSTEIPDHTLFLGVYADTRDKLQWCAEGQPDDLQAFVMADPELKELGEYLARDKRYWRVWLHVVDRRFTSSKKKRPKYDWVMARYYARAPWMATIYPYHVQLRNMDLVWN